MSLIPYLTRIEKKKVADDYPDVVHYIVKLVWKKLKPAWPLRYKVNRDEVKKLTKECLKALGRKK